LMRLPAGHQSPATASPRLARRVPLRRSPSRCVAFRQMREVMHPARRLVLHLSASLTSPRLALHPCKPFLRIPLCGHSDTLVWALWGLPSTVILICGEICNHVSGGRSHHWGVVVADARSCVFTIPALAILLAPGLFAIIVRLNGLASTFQDCFDRTPRDPRSWMAQAEVAPWGIR
jgi:hypothetical protein